MGQVVAQVVQVGPGPVGAHGLPCGCGVGERFVACGDPEPVQYPAVAGVLVEPVGVAFVAEFGDLVEQGVESKMACWSGRMSPLTAGRR